MQARSASWTNALVTHEWRTSSRVKARHRLLKPRGGSGDYLSADAKPLVIIRARLRMGVALVPHRRHIYDSSISANCPRCNSPGTVEHVLMNCPNHASARSLLVVSLLGLGIQLTLNVRCAPRTRQSIGQDTHERAQGRFTPYGRLHLVCGQDAPSLASLSVVVVPR